MTTAVDRAKARAAAIRAAAPPLVIPPEGILAFQGDYRWLSNFYSAPTTSLWHSYVWPTSEHAYQAMKCVDSDLVAPMLVMTPGQAKHFGHALPLRADWEPIEAMFLAVLAKFTRNAILRERLLATGDAHLEEGNTWGDRFWGTVNRVGENNLGKTIMRVRSYLRGDE